MTSTLSARLSVKAIQVRDISTVTSAVEELRKAQTDPQLRSRMERRGLDDQYIRKGIELGEAVQRAFASLQKTQANVEQAWAAYIQALSAARQAFKHYRSSLRPVAHQDGLVHELGLDRKIPRYAREFAATARSSYQSAYNLPAQSYRVVFETSQAPCSLLEKGAASLKMFYKADEDHEMAKAFLIDATIEYELAVENFCAWMEDFVTLAS